jgi:GntR family transcriptional regulator
MSTRKHHPLEPAWRDLYVDKGDRMPPVQQIAGAIRHKIATNRITPGDTVPSVRALAAWLGVTPATVARAYAVLKEEHLVESRAGAGSVVVDLDHIDETAQQRSLEAAQSMLAQAVHSLRALGLSSDTIRQALEACLSSVAERRRIVVVGGSPDVAAKYGRILAGELERHAVDVTHLTLAELEDPDPTVELLLRSCERAITLLSFQRRVQAAMSRFGLPVTTLLTEVTFQTLSKLESIPLDHTVLLVAEDEYRSTGIGMVRAYCDEDRLLIARDVDIPALRDIAAHADTIVHTLGTSDLVRKVVRPDQDRLELEFQPRPDALQRITRILRDVVDVPASA